MRKEFFPILIIVLILFVTLVIINSLGGLLPFDDYEESDYELSSAIFGQYHDSQILVGGVGLVLIVIVISFFIIKSKEKKK